MSMRVNLLPRDVDERNRAARQRAALGVGALGLLGVLGAVYAFQLDRVGDARARLEAEQATVAALNAEVADLQEFQQLEARLDASETLFATTLGDEVSLAGILQDVAVVLPSDAELSSLAVSVDPEATGEPELGDLQVALGTLTVSGRTLGGHAPGLERLLLELEKVAAFSDVFFATSSVDEDGVASFSIEVDLGDEILTGRYVDGLPEGRR